MLEISSPSNTQVISAPTSVLGIVQSPILDFYELQYRLQDSGQSPANGWITIGSGTNEITGPVGDFDPTLLLNGIYELRLIAEDQVGRFAASEIVNVVVYKNMQVGHFTVSFSDLNVPVSGLPILPTLKGIP